MLNNTFEFKSIHDYYEAKVMYGIEITRVDYEQARSNYLRNNPAAAAHLDSAEPAATLVWLPESGVCFGWRYEHPGILHVTGAFRTIKGDVPAAEGIQRYLAGRFGWLLQRIELQAFEGFASKAWENAGFVCTARDEFNPVYAHPDWDYFEHGKPDLLTLAWSPAHAKEEYKPLPEAAYAEACTEACTAPEAIHGGRCWGCRCSPATAEQPVQHVQQVQQQQVQVVQALSELRATDELVQGTFADYIEALEAQKEARFALAEAAKQAAGFTSQLR